MEQVNKKCLFCNGVVPVSRTTGKDVPTRKYCSYKCRDKRADEKRKNFGDRSLYENLSKSQVGALHELMVCADLIKKGYHVYREVVPGPCDLAVVKENKVILIEVTTGWLNPSGQLKHKKKDESRFDVLAVVARDGSIHYLPPLDGI